MDQLEAWREKDSLLAERLRHVVDEEALVGLVAIDRRQPRGLTIYWTGDVPTQVIAYAKEADTDIEIEITPFSKERVNAAVRYLVDASELSFRYVGPRTDCTGIRLGVDLDGIPLAEAKLAEIMAAAPPEVAEVPVTLVGTKVEFVALEHPRP